MSFFFTKAANKPTTPKAAPIRPRDVATLHRLGCVACPLNKADIVTPKMGPTLAPQTEILFLAEAPGRDEDENTGRALTGPSGQLLRSCIPRQWENSCSFDNVCNCRPESNRTPVWQEIECCRPRRQSVIEKSKPKLIVGLGSIPLSFMLGTSDIRNLRGRIFAIKVGSHECYFLPTYHPSFILRSAYDKRKPLNGRFGLCFRMDIERAFRSLSTFSPVVVDGPDSVRSGVLCFDGNSPEKILALLERARRAPIKAIDIETSCLRPYSEGAKILTIAISFEDTNFSFCWDHPQAKWGCTLKSAGHYTDKGVVGQVFYDLLADDTTKVAHNAPFEIEWLAEFFGRETINHSAWECTMMQAHFLDERKGGDRDEDTSGANRYLSLDFLSRLHFGVAYKSLFTLNKKNMEKSDLTETLIYNAVDTKYTLKLYHRLKELLQQEGLWDAYLEAAPRQPTVALMQHLGVSVDQDEVKKLQTKLEGEINGTEEKIRRLPIIATFEAQAKRSYNPLSGPDTLTIFKDYLKREEVVVEGGKNIGRYSVDKHVLDKIDHPLAELIVRLRNSTKMKSTYIDGLELSKGKLVYPDGRIHTSFHTTGTETGRLSSSDPNMQNFPKRGDSYIRRTIAAPKGYSIVAVDYSQLEGSTTAMCSGDKYYVDALKNDYDTHMVWARRLAEIVPRCTNLVDGKFRSMVKNKLVFPSFFGASVESVTAYLSDGCKMPMPQDKIEKLMDEFWDTFAGVKRWQDRLMKRYYETGYVETLSGRRRRYPLSRNEAINHPVQGTAAELVCDAMVRLSHLAATTGNWHVHPILNVHDDLTFVVPSDNATFEGAVQRIIKEMLTFEFQWVNVPLAVEVSVGTNWCDLKPLGKFWSYEV